MSAPAMRTAKHSPEALATERDPRWQSVLHRDKTADGSFYFSVVTTGVYCRPSCAARTPRPENVRFFTATGDAERAGFRACKRCRPTGPSLSDRHAALIAEACRTIETADDAPSLNELADRAGVSPYYFHRLFKSKTGLTPREYAAAYRASRMRDELGRSRTVTDAIYESGYSSSSRFYEQSNDVLGMSPRAYRAGGAETDIRFAIAECSLGSILVALSDRGVCAITMGDDANKLAEELQDRFPHARLVGGDGTFDKLVARVVAFVESPRIGLDLPLDVRGTAFQQRVWTALREIPAGTTSSYSDIAERIGSSKAVRAVAAACAANKLAVAIPCHRVVRNDGELSGYRWGVERKRALLEREAH